MQLQTEELDEATTSGDGTLRGAPTIHRRGDTSLTIFIDKWGFKDAGGLVEPRVLVSVRDESGEKVEAVQVRMMRLGNWEGRLVRCSILPGVVGFACTLSWCPAASGTA